MKLLNTIIDVFYHLGIVIILGLLKLVVNPIAYIIRKK